MHGFTRFAEFGCPMNSAMWPQKKAKHTLSTRLDIESVFSVYVSPLVLESTASLLVSLILILSENQLLILSCEFVFLIPSVIMSVLWKSITND